MYSIAYFTQYCVPSCSCGIKNNSVDPTDLFLCPLRRSPSSYAAVSSKTALGGVLCPPGPS